MRPLRPISALRPTTPTRRLGWTTPLVAVAVAGSLLLAQPAHTEHPSATAEAGPSISTTPIDLVATDRVVLERHDGYVQGDARTVYVANGTEFRPGQTRVALPPQVRARSWVVVDLDSGRLLGKHRARAKLPQASTMKLLTALTAVRTIRPGHLHRVTRFETSQVCTCAGLKRGRLYRRDTLLKGMLLPSGNDAAEAVAGSYSRGRRAFYGAMNDLARKLGASDTVAKNASGLTAAGSHSSARDLVVLLRSAVANPTIAGILGMRSAQIATASGALRHVVWRGTDYVNRYEGSLGKSGYTTPALNTLVVVTQIAGRRIAVASLGAPAGYSTSGARALTEWAGSNVDGLLGVGRLPLA